MSMNAEFAPSISGNDLLEWKHDPNCSCGHPDHEAMADCSFISTITEKSNFTEEQQVTYEWLLAVQEAEDRRAEYNVYDGPDYDDSTMIHNTTPSALD
jgi:hypothetical protein